MLNIKIDRRFILDYLLSRLRPWTFLKFDIIYPQGDASERNELSFILKYVSDMEYY